MARIDLGHLHLLLVFLSSWLLMDVVLLLWVFLAGMDEFLRMLRRDELLG